MDLQRKSPVLALDMGQRRIGIAVSDRDRRLALPLTVLIRRNREDDLKALARIAEEQEADLLVLGLPLDADDQLGASARQILRFGRRLGRFLQKPVCYVDEWETTVEAQETLLAADVSRRRRRQVVDKLAAAYILQRFLERGALARYS